MDQDKTIIYDFLNQFEDFTQGDRENGYLKVYRPERHPIPVQFWFNPPYDETNTSMPVPSSAMILKNNGEIMVQNLYTGLFFSLDDCLGPSIQNLVNSIRNYYQKLTP